MSFTLVHQEQQTRPKPCSSVNSNDSNNNNSGRSNNNNKTTAAAATPTTRTAPATAASSSNNNTTTAVSLARLTPSANTGLRISGRTTVRQSLQRSVGVRKGGWLLSACALCCCHYGPLEPQLSTVRSEAHAGCVTDVGPKPCPVLGAIEGPLSSPDIHHVASLLVVCHHRDRNFVPSSFCDERSDVLGLPIGAPLKDVKKAYHRLSMTQHPDKVCWPRLYACSCVVCAGHVRVWGMRVAS